MNHLHPKHPDCYAEGRKASLRKSELLAQSIELSLIIQCYVEYILGNIQPDL